MASVNSLPPFMSLPAEMWGYIVEYLPFRDAQNFGKICRAAQGAFKSFVADRAIEETIPALLRQETFSLSLMSKPYRKNRKFVCAAFRIDERNFNAIDKTVQKDAEVLKTAVVSLIFFNEGPDNIVKSLVETVKDGEQFLNIVTNLSPQQRPDKEVWRKHGLGSFPYSSFQNDKEVLSNILEHQDVLVIVLSDLKYKQSELLNDPNFILRAFRSHSGSISPSLRYLNPVLLNDCNFMLSVFRINALALLDFLRSTNSGLLYDQGFMFTALQIDLQKTLDCLRMDNSYLLEDSDFMLTALQIDLQKTLDCLRMTNSYLLKNSDFMLTAFQIDLQKTLDCLRMANSDLLNNFYFMPTALQIDLQKTLDCLRMANSDLLNDPYFIITAVQIDLQKTPNSALVNDPDFIFPILQIGVQKTLHSLQKANSALVNDPDFILRTLTVDSLQTLNFLKETNSAFLKDLNFILRALTIDPWQTLSCLKETNSAFLKDPDFMFRAFTVDSWETLICLKETNSAFLRDPDFMFRAFRIDPWQTIVCLKKINSAFLNDPVFVLNLFQLNLEKSLKFLEYFAKYANFALPLLDNPEFMLKIFDLYPSQFFRFFYLNGKSKLSKDQTFLLGLLERELMLALSLADESMKNDPIFKRAVVSRSIFWAHTYGYMKVFGSIVPCTKKPVLLS